MSNRTVIRTVITPRAITRRVGPAGAGGGTSTFAGLTDKATADLPAINTPLSTALAGKQPLDSDLTAIAALTTTAYGRALLALADGAAGRTAWGLGTLATQSGTFTDKANLAGGAAFTGDMSFAGGLVLIDGDGAATFDSAVEFDSSVFLGGLPLTALATTTPGTGVATALAAATNGTGGVVTFGGNIGAATGTSLTLSASTASTSKDTGALIIQNGGLGVEGAGYFGGSVVSGGSLLADAGAGVWWLGRTYLNASADGKLRIRDSNLTVGVTLDCTADGTLKIRNRLDVADGNLTAGNLTASGTIKTGSQTAAAAVASSHATAIAAGDGAQTYISDTDQPAWSNGTVWKYADGTTVT